LQSLSDAADVSAVPTFKYFKNGNKVAELAGGNPARLEELVKQNK
jgi:hypothetical protein